MSKVVSWSDGILVEEKVEDTDVADIPGIDDEDEDEEDEEDGDEEGDDDEVRGRNERLPEPNPAHALLHMTGADAVTCLLLTYNH